jgi:CheY-like chemotaxis protein
MSELLIIDDDPGTLESLEHIFRYYGHSVRTASGGRDGLDVLHHEDVDVCIVDIRLPDMSGLDVLAACRDGGAASSFIVVTGHATVKDVVDALHLGAQTVLEKPVFEDELVAAVNSALTHRPLGGDSRGMEAHAAARWAKAVVPTLDSPKDPRTINMWAAWIAASPGALRNWCRTLGIAPRRSLVFARMLRAVSIASAGVHSPVNVLDVVDRRTLTSLLSWAGFAGEADFPRSVHDFVNRQTLIRDPDVLQELERALAQRPSTVAARGRRPEATFRTGTLPRSTAADQAVTRRVDSAAASTTTNPEVARIGTQQRGTAAPHRSVRPREATRAL